MTADVSPADDQVLQVLHGLNRTIARDLRDAEHLMRRMDGPLPDEALNGRDAFLQQLDAALGALGLFRAKVAGDFDAEVARLLDGDA